jgi:CRISPR/Cas system CSM-associated protein Csm2 small subunit
MQTKKNRKSPNESARLFNIGTIKKGNDDNNWIIIETKNKTHRWKKINNNKSIKKLQNKKKVGKTINNITDYKGLWKPLPKLISKMSKEELINNLKKFRNAWETVTTRDQDLSDERLKNESTQELKNLIKFYYSDEAKKLAIEWLS